MAHHWREKERRPHHRIPIKTPYPVQSISYREGPLNHIPVISKAHITGGREEIVHHHWRERICPPKLPTDKRNVQRDVPALSRPRSIHTRKRVPHIPLPHLPLRNRSYYFTITYTSHSRCQKEGQKSWPGILGWVTRILGSRLEKASFYIFV